MANDEHDVLLVVPPGMTVRGPALGPSLLAAGCRLNGMRASVYYSNLDFAALVGYQVYERISTKDVHLLLNELIFRPYVVNSLTRDALLDDYFLMLDRVDIKDSRRGGVTKAVLDDLFDQAGRFLLNWQSWVKVTNPKIIGFSSMFQQTMASAAMARYARMECPSTLMVIGGSNVAGVMGRAVSRQFEEFDHIFSGEADKVFPEFCADYFEEGVFQDRFVDCSPISDLNDTPFPDYDDYFEQLALKCKGIDSPQRLPDWLQFETSRGCWWGERNHCTFCGLNAMEMTYRRKTAARVVSELEQLSTKYEVDTFHAADNIMPADFRKNLIPLLARSEHRPKIFCEVKSNLTEDDFLEFKKANIYMMQPGIESFSSVILKLMRKGVTGAHNIETLRNAITYEIFISWNLLVGFPGERLADYESMIKVIPLLHHLRPPIGFGPIRFDRFSPYFERPEDYNIQFLKPMSGYDVAFREMENISDLAYHFTGDYESEFMADETALHRLDAQIESWIRSWDPANRTPHLKLLRLGENAWLVHDIRAIRVNEFTALDEEHLIWLASIRKHRSSENARRDNPEIYDWATRMGFSVSIDGQVVCLIDAPREAWASSGQGTDAQVDTVSITPAKFEVIPILNYLQ